jgi:hypothetical protein
VAEDHGTPGAEVVDVAVAVGIGEPCALGSFYEGRRAADRSKGTNRRVDAAGKKRSARCWRTWERVRVEVGA